MRKTAALVVAAALVTTLVPGPAAATESTAFPVTVENCGRMLTFDKPPTRVVTGYHPMFETLVALGLGDHIIGRTHYDQNGPQGFLPGQKEVYDATREVSPTVYLPGKEALLALEPDFVIEWSYEGFGAGSGRATIQELADAGAAVYIPGGWCDAEGVRASKIADIFDDIRDLGLIFGVSDRAAELAAELEALLADVEQRVGGLEPVEVLSSDGGAGPVNVHGGSGLVNQMIELAGGRNVLADVEEDYTQVSAERIAASNPEAMVVDDYVGEDLPSAEEKADTVFALIPDSPAARDRRFLPVPAVAFHSGSRNILAVRDIAKFLHPEAFEE